MEQTLENRPIPGITAKQLVWYMGGVISLIIAIMMSYTSMKASQADSAREIDALKQNLITANVQIDNLKTNIQTNKTDIQSALFQIELLKQFLKK